MEEVLLTVWEGRGGSEEVKDAAMQSIDCWYYASSNKPGEDGPGAVTGPSRWAGNTRSSEGVKIW